MSAEILRILVVFLGVIVVALILVQQPKDGGISAFTGGGGSGASGTVFGSKGGSNFFFRITAIAMVLFVLFVIFLVRLDDNTFGGGSEIVQAVEVTEEVPGQQALPSEEIIPGAVESDLPEPLGASQKTAN